MPAVNIPTTSKEQGSASVNQPQEQVSVVKEVFADKTPWYRNNAIDSNLHTPDTIFNDLDGYRWSGTYYSQMNDSDEAPSTFQINQLAIYQQYRKIDRMELIISAAASFGTEDELSEVNYSLTALVYANGYIKPLQGDLFIADLAEGRAGIFHVSQPPKLLSIFKNAAYEIDLKLHAFVVDDQEVITAIESKVVDELVYFKEYLLNGKDPFMKQGTLVKIANLRKTLDLLEKSYVRSFYNREQQTLIYSFNHPGSSKTQLLYDNNVVEFMSQISRLDHQVNFNKYATFDGSNLDVSKPITVFDLIRERTIDLYPDLVVKCQAQPTNYQLGNVMLGGISHGSLDYYITPRTSLDASERDLLENFNQMGNVNSPGHYGAFVSYNTPNPIPLTDLLQLDNSVDVGTNPTYYPVERDGFYILSNNFYDESLRESMSTLESALVDHLSMEPVDVNKLELVLDKTKEMSSLDRFYLIPIILFLGRTAEMNLV